MYDFIKKLLDSKATLATLSCIVILAWVYNVDWVKKPMIQHNPTGRTIEEIIATPVSKTVETSWDHDFKSSVEEIK
jgi:hypothetical protein